MGAGFRLANSKLFWWVHVEIPGHPALLTPAHLTERLALVPAPEKLRGGGRPLCIYLPVSGLFLYLQQTSTSPQSASQAQSLPTPSSESQALCWAIVVPRKVDRQESSESILLPPAFPSLFSLKASPGTACPWGWAFISDRSWREGWGRRGLMEILHTKNWRAFKWHLDTPGSGASTMRKPGI